MVEPPFFDRPKGQRVMLPQQPRLASWMATDHPDQLRLRAYLDATLEAAEPHLAASDDPISLLLAVGLPNSVPLLDQHDLDNYLYPLAGRLAKTGRQISSVWGAKCTHDKSYLTIGPTVPHRLDPESVRQFTVTASVQSVAYKEQVRAGVSGLTPLPPGPVELELSYVVGPRRNWMNLWKPTIDSLGVLLGHTTETREWHPLDGRIVCLGLHCAVDPTLGNDISISVLARPGAGE